MKKSKLLNNIVDESMIVKLRRICTNTCFLIGYNVNKISKRFSFIKNLIQEFVEGWLLYQEHVKLGCA